MHPEPLQPGTIGVRSGVSYDAGLRAFFQRVYKTMAIGLVVTGLVAMFVSNSEALSQIFVYNPVIRFICAFAPLGFMFFGFTQNRIMRMSTSQLNMLFYVFSGVFGLSMATLFTVYTGESVARVFFITAGMFAAISGFGYVTKRDLSGMSSILIMGVFGLLIAMVVNIFLQSPMLMFVISGVGVLVYTGLIAWETQMLKQTYDAGHGAVANEKLAVMGAVSLYINFIMLFQFLLQFLGNRE